MLSRDRYGWLEPPERPEPREGDGDPDCDECFGSGSLIEQDPDTGRGVRVVCSCVSRRQEREDGN